MRLLALTLILVSLLLGGFGVLAGYQASDAAEAPAVAEALAQARQMSNHLAETLRSHLVAEIRSGGFRQAVSVCSEIGQQVPDDLTKQTGHRIRRVSLRYRNKQDRPDDYEQMRLREFDALKQRGRLPGEFYEVIGTGSERELRYLRPLLTADMCLNCHGTAEKIPAEVKALLAEAYPDDLATGYQTGDVRGAISIRVKLAR
jgi:hypothetical protein